MINQDKIEEVVRLMTEDPTAWAFSALDHDETDGEVTVASAIHTDGEVPTDRVVECIGSQVLKLSTETGAHPAVILQRMAKHIEQNHDAPGFSYDPSEEFRFNDE